MPAPIQASAAAMANHARACHTKRKAWRLENGYNVFARAQAVCDFELCYAKVFGVEVKMPEVQSFSGCDEPTRDFKKWSVMQNHGQAAKKSAKRDAAAIDYD